MPLRATCSLEYWKFAHLVADRSAASCSTASHASCSERTFLKRFTRGHLTQSVSSTPGVPLSIWEKVSKRESRSTSSSIASVPATAIWGRPIWGRTDLGDATTRLASASTSALEGGREQSALRYIDRLGATPSL